jgi:DNA-binding NarL/FixJ family response regulator
MNSNKCDPELIRRCENDKALMSCVLDDYSRLKKEEYLKKLTHAEREIFEMLEEGYSCPQIEQKLYKSLSTVKKQVNSVLRKLEAKNCKEAISKANYLPLSTSAFKLRLMQPS